MAFRAYSTLTVGDTIKVEYNKKIHLIDVLEVKPENIHNAITIVEADVQVDFAPPLDYVEPVKTTPIVQPQETTDEKNQEQVEETPDDEEDSFKAFTGTYHTLSGRPPRQLPSLTKSAPPQGTVTVPKVQEKEKEKEDIVFKTREIKKTNSSTTVSSADKKRKRRKRGEPIEPEQEEKPVERGPLSFSGKAYSLR